MTENMPNEKELGDAEEYAEAGSCADRCRDYCMDGFFGAASLGPTGPCAPDRADDVLAVGGGQISCDTPEGTGQDGDIQAGVEWPTPRFTDRRDGTVRDNLTGLLWLKDAGCFDLRTWPQALTDANTLASPNPNCGLTDGSHLGDWRLPNIHELLSLIDYSQALPALPAGHPFTNVRFSAGSFSLVYWTSTIQAGTTACCPQPWTVNFSEGHIFGFGLGDFRAVVWPVKGGD